MYPCTHTEKHNNRYTDYYFFFALPTSQKSPAKKLSHAISKSLGCVPIGEPPHPVFPEQAERPQELTHTV